VTIGTVALLVAGAAVGLALVEVVIRRTDIAAGILLAILIVQESSVFELGVTLGPVLIAPNDLLVVVLGTAATARLLRLERLTTAQRLLIALGVLVAWSTFRGVAPYGLPASVNQARKYLVFVAVTLYFSTVEPRRELLDRIAVLWVITGFAVCATTVLRWAGNAVGVAGPFFAGSYESGFRVVPASNTLVILQAGLIALPFLGDRRVGLVRFAAPVFLAFVVLLQHRTVWVITAAAIAYLLYLQRAVAGRVLATLVAGTLVFAGLVFTFFDSDSAEVSEQLAVSAQSTGTFEWRVEGWSTLVSESGPETVEEVLTGRPFGESWRRVMYGSVVDVSPHSFYVEPYLRIGLVGLGLLLLVYAYALRGTALARRVISEGLMAPPVLHTIIAIQLLYSITYTPEASQAMLLGLGCAVAAAAAMPNRRDQPATRVGS
jgi:hypothetical protein